MTRWLVTGAGGQLGTDLVAVLGERGLDVVGLPRARLDVADASAVDAAVRGVDVVVNAAAYTDVDGAETDEPAAWRVNADGPGALAAACARHGARLVHVSTDYVFAGTAHEPYDEDDPPVPRNAYGRSKLAGERGVLAALPSAYVVRTAWVYGGAGCNFVKTIARLAPERETLAVVDDQRGSPTWSRDLAYGLVALVQRAPDPGIYHCTNAGVTTWCGLARAVFEELDLDPARVRPTTSDAFVRPAPRPAWSVLGNRRWRAAGLAPLRPWREALHAAFGSVGAELRGTPPPPARCDAASR
jgi:dTDP-4-dehydrorhamnose reductase